jgi:hypothetical protein
MNISFHLVFHVPILYQGTLTEEEGSLLLTSSYSLTIFS